MDKETKIIVYKESLLQSIISDVVTLFLITIILALNEIYIGSTALDIVFVVIFFIVCIGLGIKKRKEFYNIDDVVSYLKS